tara:strand:- start:351 stop:1373 length:1023 start_codon:yes stop_codon:yes gene_type:complete
MMGMGDNEQIVDMTSGFDLAWQKIGVWSADFYLLLPNIVAGIIILFIFALIAYGVKRVMETYFNRKNRIDLGNLVASIAFWIMIIVGLMVALTIIMPSLKPVDLISGLGLGSLAIGFAFKDILQNWLAGLLILLRLPFRRGDQIQIGESEGTVVSIEPRATVLKTYDGKVIVVPNTEVYTNHVVVSTAFDIRRVELDITVGYDYDTNDIIEIIIQAISPLDEVMDSPAPQVLCWSLGATSMEMKIRWWVDSARAEEVISRARIVQAVKEAFELNNIDPTDPQLIFYQKNQKDETETNEKVSDEKRLKSAPAPKKIHMGADDPETEDAKLDDKSQTILPDR